MSRSDRDYPTDTQLRQWRERWTRELEVYLLTDRRARDVLYFLGRRKFPKEKWKSGPEISFSKLASEMALGVQELENILQELRKRQVITSNEDVIQLTMQGRGFINRPPRVIERAG